MGRRSGRNKRIQIRRSPSPTSKLSGAWVDSRKLLPDDAPRKHVPADLWEMGALKKAVKKALDGIYDVYDDEEKTTNIGSDAEVGNQDRKYAKATLTHVLNCWAANIEWNSEIRRQQSAGPFFLMHFLRRRYGYHGAGNKDSRFGFTSLESRDQRFLDAVLEACATTDHPFHVFLARFSRITHRASTLITDPDDGTPVEILTVEQTGCRLHDILHAAGSEIKIVPKVSEGDLVDDFYFEGRQPDGYIFEGKVAGHAWERTVVVLAPHDFADEFFGHPEDDRPEGLVWLDDIGRWIAVDEDVPVMDDGEDDGFVRFSTNEYPAHFRSAEVGIDYISMQGRLSEYEQESEDDDEHESQTVDDTEIDGYIRPAMVVSRPQGSIGDKTITPSLGKTFDYEVPRNMRSQPRHPVESHDRVDDDKEAEDVYVEDEEAMMELALQELAEYQANCKGE